MLIFQQDRKGVRYELRNTKWPGKIGVRELEIDHLARVDTQNPFEVRSDQPWETVEANLFAWLPELGGFLRKQDKDTNPSYKTGLGEVPGRQFLPQLVLVHKERVTVAVVPFMDFPNGAQVIEYSGGRHKMGVAYTTIVFGMFFLMRLQHLMQI